jgi:hypothetical protein
MTISKKKKNILLFLFILFPLFLSNCEKLDEDGGYYDEDTSLYKYVFPNRTKSKYTWELKNKTLRPGQAQQIQGVINTIDPNLKTIWLEIGSRQVYMIIAEGLSRGSRNDKDKKIKIDLSYVSPALISSKSKKFKKQWRDYLKKLFQAELVGQHVLVDIRFQEKSKKLWGIVYKIIKSDKATVIRNVNKWIIVNGLSYYIIERGGSTDDNEYLRAQNIAIQNKAGLWKYK